MKKLSLAVTVLALAAVGCDDDSSTPKTDAGMDSGQNTIPDANGGEPDPFPSCDRDAVDAYPDEHTADDVWSLEEFMACQTKCGMDEACFTDANCPGLDGFDTCFSNVVTACLTASDGDCRTPWENTDCCSQANNCLPEGTTQAAFDMCIADNCQKYVDDTRACFDEQIDFNAQIVDPCLRKTIETCLPAGGGMGDAGMGDAGMNDDGGTSTKSLIFGLPEVLLKRLKLAPTPRVR